MGKQTNTQNIVLVDKDSQITVEMKKDFSDTVTTWTPIVSLLLTLGTILWQNFKRVCRIRIKKAEIVYTGDDAESGVPNQIGLHLTIKNYTPRNLAVECAFFVVYTARNEIGLSLKFASKKDASYIREDQEKEYTLEAVFPPETDIALDNHFCLLRKNPESFKKLLSGKKIQKIMIELKTEEGLHFYKLRTQEAKLSVCRLIHLNEEISE